MKMLLEAILVPIPLLYLTPCVSVSDCRRNLQEGMPKVHPNAGVQKPLEEAEKDCEDRPQDTPPAMMTMTVWRKSLLFNCNGFTVFDAKGNLVFRVDNYASRGGSGEVVLMDAAGKSLLTVRRKKLSLIKQWLVYDGEEATNHRLSARKHAGIFNVSKSLARISARRDITRGGGRYDVEGSYPQRSCTVYDSSRRPVAEIRRKEPVGGVAFCTDVFRLVVHPDVEPVAAMTIVVVLEEMFGSR